MSKRTKPTNARSRKSRPKANALPIVVKLPPPLEKPQQPIPVENLKQITDEELHRRLMDADVKLLIAACLQPVASLVARAEKAKTTTLDAAIICMIAHRAMRALEHLAAQGNVVAAKELYRTVNKAVENLNQEALANPGLFMPAAREHIEWPVLYSPHPHFSTNIEDLHNKLKVGENFHLDLFPWKDRKRGTDLNLVKNKLAFQALQVVMSAHAAPPSADSLLGTEQPSDWKNKARSLKPFSRETAHEWAALAWQVILEAYENTPETDPDLAKLGKSLSSERRTPAATRARIKSAVKACILGFVRTPR
ncbi:MAG: hypothetical protein MUE94_08400 [Verrucomicrobia bacterium]|jgi:hypothetical protein|nr:hypothetical protein [Verrucomicrobiota bacterium]